MAHFAGLVAVGVHRNPTAVADFVTSTIHKTLSGPRSGHAEAIDQAVSPGTRQRHSRKWSPQRRHVFASLRRRLFVPTNVRFAQTQAGSPMHFFVEGSHSCRAVPTPISCSLTYAERFGTDETPNGACTRSISPRPVTLVPGYRRAPTETSGLRLGTTAVTMRGFDTEDSAATGSIIASALIGDGELSDLGGRARALCGQHPLYPGSSAFAP